MTRGGEASDTNAFRDLFDGTPEVERLSGGFVFTEGPVWIPEGGYLLFSDVSADRRYRWDERAGIREVAAATSRGIGMTLDREGRLLVCEGETGAVVAMDASGTGRGRAIVAERHRGMRLNSPNDVVVRSDGSTYFTVPCWMSMLRPELDRELGFQGVFRVVAGEEPDLLVDDADFPNGLCFSPDESLLYVNDSTLGRIRVFDVATDGSLSNDRVFADGIRGATHEAGAVDGMKCDARGNVWVTGPGGVWVLDPAGSCIGVLSMPERTTNLHWGGPCWRWLFLTATCGIYRVRTNTSGRREPFMTRPDR